MAKAVDGYENPLDRKVREGSSPSARTNFTLASRRRKRLNNATVRNKTITAAALANTPQLGSEPCKVRGFRFDVGQMPHRNPVHFGTLLAFLRGQPQQIPDLFKREA